MILKKVLDHQDYQLWLPIPYLEEAFKSAGLDEGSIKGFKALLVNTIDEIEKAFTEPNYIPPISKDIFDELKYGILVSHSFAKQKQQELIQQGYTPEQAEQMYPTHNLEEMMKKIILAETKVDIDYNLKKMFPLEEKQEYQEQPLKLPEGVPEYTQPGPDPLHITEKPVSEPPTPTHTASENFVLPLIPKQKNLFEKIKDKLLGIFIKKAQDDNEKELAILTTASGVSSFLDYARSALAQGEVDKEEYKKNLADFVGLQHSLITGQDLLDIKYLDKGIPDDEYFKTRLLASRLESMGLQSLKLDHVIKYKEPPAPVMLSGLKMGDIRSAIGQVLMTPENALNPDSPLYLLMSQLQNAIDRHYTIAVQGLHTNNRDAVRVNKGHLLYIYDQLHQAEQDLLTRAAHPQSPPEYKQIYTNVVTNLIRPVKTQVARQVLDLATAEIAHVP